MEPTFLCTPSHRALGSPPEQTTCTPILVPASAQIWVLGMGRLQLQRSVRTHALALQWHQWRAESPRRVVSVFPVRWARRWRAVLVRQPRAQR